MANLHNIQFYTMEVNLKDFLGLDIFSKSTVITIIVLMPFWYISFYLFHKGFYKDSDILIKVLFSFCLSISWYISNLILFFIAAAISGIHTYENVFKYSGILSVLFIALVIWNYQGTPMPYTTFLNHCLASLGVFHVPSIIGDIATSIRKRKKEKNNIQTSEIAK